MGSWQAELWQSRGGQLIPLAHSQASIELQYKKTVLFEDFLVCCRVLCAKILWDGSCKVLELFWDLFYWYSWSVGGRFSPSSLPCFLKPSHVCASLYLAFFPLFHAMSTPALHLIPSTQKQIVPVCRACKTHLPHNLSQNVPSDVYHWNQWDVCEQVWRQTAAQFGFTGCPKSGWLVSFLNGRVCSASRLMQCLPWLGEMHLWNIAAIQKS